MDTVTAADILLRFPKIPMIQASRTRIKMSCLNPAVKPVVDEESESVTLTWAQRIYDAQKQPEKLSSALDDPVRVKSVIHCAFF